MRYWIILCLSLPLLGMELSLQNGKEEGQPYSILHLRHSSSFSCQEYRNEFGEITRAECGFTPTKPREFAPIDNAHFKISAKADPAGYRITVVPKGKMKLFPVAFDLSKTPHTYQSNISSAKHWTFIGYTRKLPLISPSTPSSGGLNFPIPAGKEVNPSVGGLDLKGNPIKIAQVQDVTDYMQMKKAYGSKDYEKVLNLADYALENYPNSVFKNELMLYQIRALHELEEYDRLIEVSKQFMRNYASDNNVAEILAYTAHAYSKIGQIADADYFFDRLFSEHAESPYAPIGMIYKAQQLEFAGAAKKAARYYQNALDNSRDVEVASQAAFKLAQIELAKGNTPQARTYVEKIIKANPKYFSKVREDAMTMSDTFVYRKDAKTGIVIAEALLNASQTKTPQHELMLRNLGLRLAKTERKSEALKRLNEYLDTYKYGDYVEEVERAKDGLFFRENDINSSEEIKSYDDLIERYGNDSIGKKALYKKAQILLKEKRYQEVLDLENDLHRLDSEEYPKTNVIIAQSAVGIQKEHLKAGRCTEAMKMHKMYKIKLTPEWDALRFGCALKTAQYTTAKQIAQSHLKSKSLDERQIWLLRTAQLHMAIGEYPLALKAAEEQVSMLDGQNKALNEACRIAFDAAQRLGNGDKMIRHIKTIEEKFPSDFKDIERYTQMVSLGLKRKDEMMVQGYAQKVMRLQERTKTYTQSPYIEFTLAQSLQNVGKEADALKILRGLDARKLNPERRARQYYLIGAIAQKLGRRAEARAAFNASIKADAASAWGKLAKDALGLL